MRECSGVVRVTRSYNTNDPRQAAQMFMDEFDQFPEYVDNNMVEGVCEVCSLPLFDFDYYRSARYGVKWHEECPFYAVAEETRK